MYAAVLHTIGTVPRYEEFPEPVIGDKDGETVVHVHAASLKPVDKHWPADRTTQVGASYPASPARMESGVLILDATGVTGKLVVKIARFLGAARVVAAGRNEQALNALYDLGADATISLALPAAELDDAFLREAGQSGFQVVIDYVWGRPAEAFLAAITRKEFSVIQSETRVWHRVGAAPTITLPAAVLRSTALTILARIPARDVLVEAFQRVMAHAAKGELHIDTEGVPLADIENAWQRDEPGKRLVVKA